MNDLIFAFNDNMVRTVHKDGEPWFLAKDVAAILGYRDASNMTRLLDNDEKGTHIVSTLGGKQDVSTINESGVYHAVFLSRKPEAVAFRKWVTGTVLPEPRKNGGYGKPAGGITAEQAEKMIALEQNMLQHVDVLKKNVLQYMDATEKNFDALEKNVLVRIDALEAAQRKERKTLIRAFVNKRCSITHDAADKESVPELFLAFKGEFPESSFRWNTFTERFRLETGLETVTIQGEQTNGSSTLYFCGVQMK